MGGTIKFWDVNSTSASSFSTQNAKGETTVSAAIVNLSTSQNTCYVASSGGKIHSLDFRNNKMIQVQHNLLPQITSIAAFPNDEGYIASNIWGHVELVSQGTKRELFRSHRNQKMEAYAANCVAVSTEKPCCVSVGSDGQYALYSPYTMKKGRESKLSNAAALPLTSCCFAPRNDVMAVAQGYDWSKGAEEFGKNYIPVEIFLKKMSANDYNIQ